VSVQNGVNEFQQEQDYESNRQETASANESESPKEIIPLALVECSATLLTLDPTGLELDAYRPDTGARVVMFIQTLIVDEIRSSPSRFRGKSRKVQGGKRTRNHSLSLYLNRDSEDKPSEEPRPVDGLSLHTPRMDLRRG